MTKLLEEAQRKTDQVSKSYGAVQCSSDSTMPNIKPPDMKIFEKHVQEMT